MLDEVILKGFEAPDETRIFEKGKFDIVNIGGMTITLSKKSEGGLGRVRAAEHALPADQI